MLPRCFFNFSYQDLYSIRDRLEAVRNLSQRIFRIGRLFCLYLAGYAGSVCPIGVPGEATLPSRNTDIGTTCRSTRGNLPKKTEVSIKFTN